MGEGILTIAILQNNRNCLLLNGGGLLKALFEDPHE